MKSHEQICCCNLKGHEGKEHRALSGRHPRESSLAWGPRKASLKRLADELRDT